MSIVRQITKYECEDGTDIEFAPSTDRRGLYEVWVNGVFIELMERGARPNKLRAQYYYEVHGRGLAERVGAELEDDLEDARPLEAAMH